MCCAESMKLNVHLKHRGVHFSIDSANCAKAHPLQSGFVMLVFFHVSIDIIYVNVCVWSQNIIKLWFRKKFMQNKNRRKNMLLESRERKRLNKRWVYKDDAIYVVYCYTIFFCAFIIIIILNAMEWQKCVWNYSIQWKTEVL